MALAEAADLEKSTLKCLEIKALLKTRNARVGFEFQVVWLEFSRFYESSRPGHLLLKLSFVVGTNSPSVQ
jgi:hypothetical protein